MIKYQQRALNKKEKEHINFKSVTGKWWNKNKTSKQNISKKNIQKQDSSEQEEKLEKQVQIYQSS